MPNISGSAGSRSDQSGQGAGSGAHSRPHGYETRPFASVKEGETLGDELEKLFSDLKDQERRQVLKNVLNKAEDEGYLRSLKSAVRLLQKMLNLIPTTVP